MSQKAVELGYNHYFTVDDLDLTEDQKEQVLEFLARKLWLIIEESSGDPDYHHKSYDPLIIEGNTAHSYVFNLGGGRHHNFDSLVDLEDKLLKDTIRRIKDNLWWQGYYE